MAGPLQGVKVVDVSAVISGPMCALVLADQGAEVIKVEPLGMGDITRMGGFRHGGISAMFAAANRGKQSVALNLSDERGKQILRELIADADVFVQNFRPGAVERMGIGPDELLAINPDLIYVSISGFGPDGPYSDWRVYDPIIQAVSGVVSVQQSRDIPIPDLIRTLVCDKATALTAAQAVTAALFARAMGNARGQHVVVPMLDTTLYYLWPDTYMGHALTGPDIVPGPLLYNIYRLQPTGDGHLVYFAGSDVESYGLFRALGRPELIDDPRFATMASRQLPANFAALGEILEAEFLARSTAELMERLHAEQVPAAQVNSLDDVFTDPQVVHNNSIHSFEHDVVGTVRLAKPPVRWGTTVPETSWRIDQLGESTDDVLEALGYDADQRAALRDQGVIS
jgi:crotonobetainyl-CoA:carnitine CoA-transferase CaiB-like acyl-CoA transferase